MWLGPVNEESVLAMDLILELSSKIEVNYITQTIQPINKNSPIQDHWMDIEEPFPYR